MYLEHFGLHQWPFSVVPNPAFYVHLPAHQQALNTMWVGIRSGEGFIKIVGEVGSGKTLVCRKLIQMMKADPHYRVIYQVQPPQSATELVYELAAALGARVSKGMEVTRVRAWIHRKLKACHAAGQQVVAIFDEAQAFSDPALEALRWLTNWETDQHKLLQVVLVGQPELDRKLQQHHLRQLKQRITFSHQMVPMNRQELFRYVKHRLGTAGAVSPHIFTAAGLDQMHAATGGLPRLVNLVAHKAMMIAYGRGADQVGLSDVQVAILDTECSQRRSQSAWKRWFSAWWPLGRPAATRRRKEPAA